MNLKEYLIENNYSSKESGENNFDFSIASKLEVHRKKIKDAKKKYNMIVAGFFVTTFCMFPLMLLSNIWLAGACMCMLALLIGLMPGRFEKIKLQQKDYEKVLAFYVNKNIVDDLYENAAKLKFLLNQTIADKNLPRDYQNEKRYASMIANLNNREAFDIELKEFLSQYWRDVHKAREDIVMVKDFLKSGSQYQAYI